MPYKVDIVISAENRLDALKGAEGEIQKFGQIATQANQRAAQSFQQSAQTQQQSTRQLIQGYQGVGQAAQQASAGGVRLNTAFAPIGATLKSVTGASEGLSAALVNMVRFAFNPLTIVAGVVAGAVSFLTTRWQEAGRASEQFTSMTADLHKDLSLINLEYRRAIGLISDLDLAQARFRQNQQSRDLEALQERVARLRSIVGALPEVVKDEKLGFPNLLGLLGFSKDDLHRAEAELAALETFVGARDKAFARNFRADQGRESSNRQISAAESFTNAIKQQNETLALQIIQLTDGEAAMSDWRQQLLEAHAADLKLNQMQRQSVEDNRKLTLTIRELNEEQARRQELAKFYVASGQEIERREQEEIGYLTKKNQLLAQANQFELEKIRASGASEGVVLQRQLELLRQQREAFLLAPKEPGQLLDLERQIELVEIRAQRMGQVTIDVGRSVADTFANIAQGIATGTLKGFDVVRAAGASALNLVTDIFRQTLQQKLSFELTLLTNVRGLPAQMNSALAAGAAAVPSGGSGGGGIGGFLSSIFNFGGGGGGSSSGGGFSFGGLGNIFSGGIDWLTTLINETPFLTGNGAGGLLGGAITTQGLGSFLGVLGGLVPIISNFARGNIGGGIGGTLGGGVGAFFGGPVGFGIGSLLGSLLGGLFGGTPNPTVRVKSQLEGFIYDAVENAFRFGNITTRGSGTDISGSMVKQTTNEVQAVLEAQAKVWTDILNLFPTIVHDRMIPSIEGANKLLNEFFGRLKFSEGGSRNIAEELKYFSERTGPGRFFIASRGILGAGIAESLGRAGLTGLDDLIGTAFGTVPPGSPRNLNRTTFPGLNPPKNAKDTQAFVDAVSQFAGFTGGLAGISPRGIGQFLTASDLQSVQNRIGDILQITDGKQFTTAVQQMIERLKPVSDFLARSVQESSDIFGRGMIAALEAATSSQALQAFQQTLGVGIKDKIFAGITESFIASAQFTDLLAPIQQTIREFTQEAIATGQTPDIDAFRRAILPRIEDISTRAETLAPLIEELQKLGLDVKDALGLIEQSARSPANITINIAEFTGSDQDVSALAHKLDEALRAVLNP